MLDNPTHFADLSVTLTRLVSAYRSHQPDKAQTYQDLLLTRFPNSPVARSLANKNS